MNLCDSCETVSHCTANGCIPLIECINSGQVSAAQVVAHQEAGELPEPFGFLLPTERSPAFHYMRRSDEKGMSVFSADQMRAAIAAERAEVARLREALTLAVRQNEHDMVMTGDELRFCCAALNNPNQGATNHD